MKANELYKKNNKKVPKKQNGGMEPRVIPYGKNGEYGHTVITKTGYKNIVPDGNGYRITESRMVPDGNGLYISKSGPTYERLGDYRNEPMNFLENPTYSREAQRPIVKKPKPIGPFKGSPAQQTGTLKYNPFDTTSNLFMPK